MGFEILEIIYHVSGILIAAFFLLVVLILKKEGQEQIRSRIFLRYNRFKTAFYIAFIGASFFLVGNGLGLYNHELLNWVHNVTETIYNLSLLTFIIMFYNLIRTKKSNVK